MSAENKNPRRAAYRVGQIVAAAISITIGVFACYGLINFVEELRSHIQVVIK